ncbi:HNH endonuclease [Micromonospora coriariae]
MTGGIRRMNGLLLRADVHNLFDKGLMWIPMSRPMVCRA